MMAERVFPRKTMKSNSTVPSGFRLSLVTRLFAQRRKVTSDPGKPDHLFSRAYFSRFFSS